MVCINPLIAARHRPLQGIPLMSDRWFGPFDQDTRYRKLESLDDPLDRTGSTPEVFPRFRAGTPS